MKAAAKVAAQIGLIALCLTPVVRQLASDWGTISLLAAQLQFPSLLAAAGLLILSSFFLPVAMTVFTRGGTSRIGYRDSALAYFGSQPMKYQPQMVRSATTELAAIFSASHQLWLTCVSGRSLILFWKVA